MLSNQLSLPKQMAWIAARVPGMTMGNLADHIPYPGIPIRHLAGRITRERTLAHLKSDDSILKC